MSRSVASLIPGGIKAFVPRAIKARLRTPQARETPNVRLAEWLKDSTRYRDIGDSGPLITDVFEPAKRIPGWFTVDDAAHFSLLLRYQSLIGIKGDVFEIGSYFGRSTAIMAAYLAPGENIVVCDAFEMNIEDKYPAKPTPETLVRNLHRVVPDLPDDQIEIHRCYSDELTLPPDRKFRFIHIDGGHSAERAEGDLKLCARHLVEGGVMVLDDYCNVWWPGVTKGADHFLETHPHIRPLADLNRHGGDGRKLYLMDTGPAV